MSAEEAPLETSNPPFETFTDLWEDLQSPASRSPDFRFLFPDGTEHRAHKMVLGEKTEFFRGLFASGMADTFTSEIAAYQPCSILGLRTFLQYVYTGQAHVDSSNFRDVVVLSDFYGTPALTNHIWENVSATCFFEALQTFADYGAGDPPHRLKQLSTYMLTIVQTKDLTNRSPEFMALFISLLSLSNITAVRCFKLFLDWLRSNRDEPPPKEGRSLVLQNIPFERMWQDEFGRWVVPCGILSLDEVREIRKRVPIPRDFASTTGFSFSPFEYPFTWCYNISIFHQSRKVVLVDLYLGKVLVFDSQTGGLLRAFHATEPTSACFVNETAIAFCCDYCVGQKDFGNGGGGSQEKSWRLGLYASNYQAIAFDHSKREAHVACPMRHCVQIYSPEAQTTRSEYGSKWLKCATGIAVDGERGLSFVVDTHFPGVLVFKTTGEYIKSFGQDGALGSPFSSARVTASGGCEKYVALDPRSGYLVVSDSGTKQIQVFKQSGDFVAMHGGPKVFQWLRGVAVDEDSRIYVCCRHASKEQVLII